MIYYIDLTDLEHLELRGKISPAACLGTRTLRPLCCCCGGSNGIRAALRKFHRYDPNYFNGSARRWNTASRGAKPREKDHRR